MLILRARHYQQEMFVLRRKERSEASRTRKLLGALFYALLVVGWYIDRSRGSCNGVMGFRIP